MSLTLFHENEVNIYILLDQIFSFVKKVEWRKEDEAERKKKKNFQPPPPLYHPHVVSFVINKYSFDQIIHRVKLNILHFLFILRKKKKTISDACVKWKWKTAACREVSADWWGYLLLGMKWTVWITGSLRAQLLYFDLPNGFGFSVLTVFKF